LASTSGSLFAGSAAMYAKVSFSNAMLRKQQNSRRGYARQANIMLQKTRLHILKRKTNTNGSPQVLPLVETRLNKCGTRNYSFRSNRYPGYRRQKFSSRKAIPVAV